MDGEEDEEKGVVINMVVKEDDGQCKVLLSGGLCKFFSPCWSWLSGNVYEVLRKANFISCQ